MQAEGRAAVSRKLGKTQPANSGRHTSQLLHDPNTLKPNQLGRNKGVEGVDRRQLDEIALDRAIKQELKEVWDD
tara:strand:- start:4650 stop:4871 length:222 start_codon:yes stop_codon:yes gene_type:complete